jgi:hypothetical protein
MVVKLGLLTFSEEHIPRVFERRMLRAIFGPKTDEMLAGWRKLQTYEVLCQIHSDYIKEKDIGTACSMYGEKRNSYRSLVKKSERKIPLGRPKRKWEDNIKMGLREANWSSI